MSDSTIVSDEQQAASGQPDKSNDKVAYETYQRTLAEAKDAKAKLKAIEAERASENDTKLKAQNEWKALAEQKEKSLFDTQAKLSELENTILESVKLNAFQRHLNGKLKDDAYYQFIDTDKIVYNPETKRVDDDSVKAVVAEFVKRHSSLIEFKAGKMPNEAGSQHQSVGSKSIESMSKVELEQYMLSLHKNGALK